MNASHDEYGLLGELFSPVVICALFPIEQQVGLSQAAVSPVVDHRLQPPCALQYPLFSSLVDSVEVLLTSRYVCLSHYHS